MPRIPDGELSPFERALLLLLRQLVLVQCATVNIPYEGGKQAFLLHMNTIDQLLAAVLHSNDARAINVGGVQVAKEEADRG